MKGVWQENMCKKETQKSWICNYYEKQKKEIKLSTYHLKAIHGSWQHSPGRIHIIALNANNIRLFYQQKQNKKSKLMAAAYIPFCLA
jgi:hypothetical protein